MIYADQAATTQMSESAVRTMISLMNDCWGNPSSLYEHGQKAKEVLEKAREDIAAVIGAEPKEILFTSGGSESDNQAILSAVEYGSKAHGTASVADNTVWVAVLAYGSKKRDAHTTGNRPVWL